MTVTRCCPRAILGIIPLLLLVLLSGWSEPGSRLEAAVAAPDSLTAVLTATADALISQQQPNNSYGTLAALTLSIDEFFYEYNSLVKYDLSSIPAGSTIIEATLSLHETSNTDALTDLTVSVGRLTGPWVEDSVTWNTAPAAVCCEGTGTIGRTSNQRYVIEIKDLVDKWVNQPGVYPNHGALLTHSAADSSYYFYFGSRESANAPDLVVHYIPPSGSKTAVFTPVADSFISQNVPGTNYGSGSEVVIANTEFFPYQFLMQFDLSSIPAGAIIDEATLLLELTDHSSFVDTDIKIERVVKPWMESSVTYDNRPTIFGSYGSAPVRRVIGRKYAADMTALVDEWVSDPALNYGFQVSPDGLTGENYFYFSSREGVDPPQLLVTYHYQVNLPLIIR